MKRDKMSVTGYMEKVVKLNQNVLKKKTEHGIIRVNYTTDGTWNRPHGSITDFGVDRLGYCAG